MTAPAPARRYEDLGIRPLINGIGTITRYSGSVMLPEVRDAMREASTRYVMLEELQAAVGARLAQVMQCEWGLVTNGCAAALTQVTAACMTGGDPKAMGQLPDTTGLKNEVLVQKSHRMGYERAILTAGARLVQVDSPAAYEAAFGERTAMVFVFGDAAERGEVPMAQVVAVAHAHGVPVLVDAAAERPDVPNVYLAQGADVVAYSGGKCLRGPQSSGMVLGRRDLLEAALANGCPNAHIGRPMKAGKEEIMGLLAAVEQWVRRDHDAEWREWERRIGLIADAATAVDGVTTSVRTPRPSNIAPHLTIAWDAGKVGVTAGEVRQALAAGEPRIEVSGGKDSLTINPYMLEDGEAEIIARRLAEELRHA